MRVLAPAAMVLVGALLCVLAVQPQPALACSGEPDLLIDPSDIVGGLFAGWEATPDEEPTVQQDGDPACGAIDADPTGRNDILRLSAQDGGTDLGASSLLLFIGPRGSGEADERAMARLATLPPDATHSGLAAEKDVEDGADLWQLSLASAAAPAFALVTVGLVGLLRRRSISG